MTALNRAASIDDLRTLAHRRLPGPIFDYIDGGGFHEQTLRSNVADFAAIRFRQRIGIDISGRDTRTTLLGRTAAFPAAIAPTGLSGLIHGGVDGERMAARAARAAGIPYILGMVSVAPIEEIARETDDLWYQLCPLEQRTIMTGMMTRAAAAGCRVLVLTMSWPVGGHLPRLVRSRSGALPPRWSVPTLLSYARAPRWSWRALTQGRPRLGNFEPHLDKPVPIARVRDLLATRTDWESVRWVRDAWPGRLMIKGVMDETDAERAVAIGADAISVSNHGGNHLDGAPSTIATLPRIVTQVGDRMEVYLDGGIRSGQDVLRAVGRGAAGVLLGRAHLYGLAAGGHDGVVKALEIIHRELDLTMAFAGLTSPAEASRALL